MLNIRDTRIKKGKFGILVPHPFWNPLQINIIDIMASHFQLFFSTISLGRLTSVTRRTVTPAGQAPLNGSPVGKCPGAEWSTLAHAFLASLQWRRRSACTMAGQQEPSTPARESTLVAARLVKLTMLSSNMHNSTTRVQCQNSNSKLKSFSQMPPRHRYLKGFQSTTRHLQTDT